MPLLFLNLAGKKYFKFIVSSSSLGKILIVRVSRWLENALANLSRMLMAKLILKLTYLKCQSQRNHPTRAVSLWAVANILAKFLERHT